MPHEQKSFFEDGVTDTVDQTAPEIIDGPTSDEGAIGAGRQSDPSIDAKPHVSSPERAIAKSLAVAAVERGSTGRAYSPREEVERYLSVRQVADRFAVSVQTVWRWKKDSVAFPKPVVLSPGTTRWRMSDLVAFERNFVGEAQ